jgi:hypothetical protein
MLTSDKSGTDPWRFSGDAVTFWKIADGRDKPEPGLALGDFRNSRMTKRAEQRSQTEGVRTWSPQELDVLRLVLRTQSRSSNSLIVVFLEHVPWIRSAKEFLICHRASFRSPRGTVSLCRDETQTA